MSDGTGEDRRWPCRQGQQNKNGVVVLCRLARTELAGAALAVCEQREERKRGEEGKEEEE